MGAIVDETAFNPDADLILFFLAGLFKGWIEVMEPETLDWLGLSTQKILRLYVIGTMVLWATGEWWNGMALGSVMHFVFKDLGVYQFTRMVSWALVLLAARLGLVRPPRARGDSNP